MKHVWSVICQSSSIDFERNSLSLFNCVEEISIVVKKDKQINSDKIFIPSEFQLLSYWSVDNLEEEKNIDLRCEMFNGDNELLSVFNNSLVVKKGAPRFRSRINIKGIPVKGQGRYYFKVWQKISEGDYELISEIPLDVKLKEG